VGLFRPWSFSLLIDSTFLPLSLIICFDIELNYPL
jgi:hypothetical protein